MRTVRESAGRCGRDHPSARSGAQRCHGQETQLITPNSWSIVRVIFRTGFAPDTPRSTAPRRLLSVAVQLGWSRQPTSYDWRVALLTGVCGGYLWTGISRTIVLARAGAGRERLIVPAPARSGCRRTRGGAGHRSRSGRRSPGYWQATRDESISSRCRPGRAASRIGHRRRPCGRGRVGGHEHRVLSGRDGSRPVLPATHPFRPF
jgi:hypothetical protein